mmetsp:Transcript_13185/g.19867  ORF Transcript_13185/g.19867 Transcript_13185/m.19867 type:complete len:97 (-) Transcript_13185:67-357(-)
MQIWVKTLTGRKISFNFESEQTVSYMHTVCSYQHEARVYTLQVIDVKHAIEEKEGIQVDQIRLIYCGQQLNNEKSLADYNVSAGETFNVVLQLRGG